MKSNVTTASTGWKGGSAMRPGAEGKAFSPKAKLPGMRSLRTPPVFIPAIPSWDAEMDHILVIGWIKGKSENRRPWFLPKKKMGFPVKMNPSSNSVILDHGFFPDPME